MTFSRSDSEQDRRPTSREMREALALTLDGSLPASDREAAAAYCAAVTTLSPAVEAHLSRLRAFADGGLVWASGRNDNTHHLLHALGLRAQSTCAIPEDDSWPGVIFLGCIPARKSSYGRWLDRMLRRGAIVVSSDRTVEAPAIAAVLQTGRRSGARRARIAIRPDLADLMTSDAGWGCLAGTIAPAVRLAPGHVPLTGGQRFEVDIIARDAFTDDPLVVRAGIHNGQVVHSVAHWWQNVHPDTTEVGPRPLSAVPAFARLGHQYPDAHYGAFAAGSALLGCLLAGLDVALDRCGRPLPPSSANALFSGD